MKESISIIFAAIIGTFLIVILPLYSILDRQDSMSYNVVLTETTNFVDNIRKNGFIDSDSYLDYLASLSSTSNTYKVSIEAYKNVLIRETDENGNIIADSYVEQKELYNTQDILDVLYDTESSQNVDKSNIKNNVYLLNENDEVYVRVHNTNITTGSILYGLIAGPTNNRVIDISYGGIVNDVNWELYNKIQYETSLMPEVILSVPVNSQNNTNIHQITETGGIEYINCNLENSDAYYNEETLKQLCSDSSKVTYAYIYDLAKQENKTIRAAVELRRFHKIDIGTITDENTDTYTKISELNPNLFDDNLNGGKSTIESYIIRNYIRLNGMYANIDLRLRQKGDYYVFDIVLTNVTMSSLDYISTRASITVLAGLGEDDKGLESLAGETVAIELFDETVANTVSISSPHIWKKLIKTKSISDSVIGDSIVYANEEIAFVISYTGINGHTNRAIADAIKDNLKIYETNSLYSNLELYTVEELNDEYGINIATEIAGHVLVKFSYNSANSSKKNYIQLLDNWIETNIEDVTDLETGSDVALYAMGSMSRYYQVLLDNSGPLEPSIAVSGTKGNNGWYTSAVTLQLLPSRGDTISPNKVGGSGVYRNTLTLSGAITEEEQERESINLTKDGITYAVAKSYDYVGNVSTGSKEEIKIDAKAPTVPKVTLNGTEGSNGWYTSKVSVTIEPGKDETSGIAKTTYRIEGANSISETTGLRYTLTKQGKSTLIATTYDNAGNKSEKRVDIYIDTKEPPKAKIEVISGEKNNPDNIWYSTAVTLRITVDSGAAVSGLGKASYKITGNSEVSLTEFTGNTKDVKITKNGTHNMTVYTYTQAGNVSVTTYTVNIDKSAPNMPTIDVLVGSEGENDWFTSNVELAIKSNGDVGTSLEKAMTYTITSNGSTTREQEIENNSKLFFNEEGEYILTVYSRDMALNKVEARKTIKIDKTAPTPAEFVINGKEGINGWYISNVKLSHKGAQDSVSGINTVTLSRESISTNTRGTKVTLTTKDYAGHTVVKDVTIKLDKSVPTLPIINIAEQPSGSNIFGVKLYNKTVNVTITPGVDSFLPDISNQDKTTYEVTTNSGKNVLIAETEGTSFKIEQEGIITVTARTYDKAGNVSVDTKVIMIDKSVPATPKIITINGESVENVSTKEIKSNSNKVTLKMGRLTEGNDVTIVLIDQETYKRTQIEKTANGDGTIEFEINKQGTYSISVTQTNMFGTESAESEGLYYYSYKR